MLTENSSISLLYHSPSLIIEFPWSAGLCEDVIFTIASGLRTGFLRGSFSLLSGPVKVIILGLYQSAQLVIVVLKGAAPQGGGGGARAVHLVYTQHRQGGSVSVGYLTYLLMGWDIKAYNYD